MIRSVLQEVAAGRPAAVEACLERFRSLVWSVARSHLNHDHDAEDAVQDVFVSLWRSARRFDPEKGSERSFVRTLARRRMIDQLRQEGRRPASVDGEVLHELEGPEPTDRAELRDEADRARRALEDLRPEQRQVLERFLLDGHSHRTIARDSGLPLGTVKSHARRGLARMRGQLGLAAAS